MSVGSTVLAPVVSVVGGGVGNAMFGLASRYIRLLPRGLVKRVVPKPGTGPSAAARERGYYRIETYTTTTTGARYLARMAQDGDPGYKATSVLLGECGLALALDRDKLSDMRGVLTPAAAMGDALLERLPPPVCRCRPRDWLAESGRFRALSCRCEAVPRIDR